MPDPSAPRAEGRWMLSGERLIIVRGEGPATILVPSESVRLLAVDLPLASRAKRIEALPFAIEDRIAEPLESVHLALGEQLAPKRYLAGVVRHEVMARWVELAEAAGLGHAAILPDALALPVPADGQWVVDLGPERALVRAGDGTGFAVAPALLRPAWEAAGRPPCLAIGAPLPEEMAAGSDLVAAPAPASPALDLRQGPYARRYRAVPNLGRRLAWILGLGALAHASIAAADTLALRAIAERRQADTVALVATMAPGAQLGEDVAAGVADMLPAGGGGSNGFLPAINRVSAALAPLGAAVAVRTMRWENNALLLELDGSAPGLAARVRAALAEARVPASVAEAGGGIQVRVAQ